MQFAGEIILSGGRLSTLETSLVSKNFALRATRCHFEGTSGDNQQVVGLCHHMHWCSLTGRVPSR